MGTTETYQYVSEDPRIVAYKEGLLQDASDFVRNQMGFNMVIGEDGQPTLEPILDPETGQPIGPAYQPIRQVAGLTAPEQEAIALAQQGVGSYAPFLQRGLDASETALQGLEGAAGEFVMTAKAVRGAGNGSRKEGVRRMYDMMRTFEGGTA